MQKKKFNSPSEIKFKTNIIEKIIEEEIQTIENDLSNKDNNSVEMSPTT